MHQVTDYHLLKGIFMFLPYILFKLVVSLSPREGDGIRIESDNAKLQQLHWFLGQFISGVVIHLIILQGGSDVYSRRYWYRSKIDCQLIIAFVTTLVV